MLRTEICDYSLQDSILAKEFLCKFCCERRKNLDRFSSVLLVFMHNVLIWSHRLAVQDIGLSRREHGFESRWDHTFSTFSVRDFPYQVFH